MRNIRVCAELRCRDISNREPDAQQEVPLPTAALLVRSPFPVARDVKQRCMASGVL